jgi:hypothetical protein
MAGLYAVFNASESQRLHTAIQNLTFDPKESSQVIHCGEVGIAWVSHDDPLLFGPAHHPSTGVWVITAGRIAWNEPEWQRAENLEAFQGGLSNRLVLEAYLKGGISAVERHNGSAILLIWDPRNREMHLLTDHFGFSPVFLYAPESTTQCVISTLPDAIADDPAVTTTPDWVSMAEFLKEWAASSPHTYYQEIKYAGAATHCCWNLAAGTYRSRHYWQPLEAEPFTNFAAAVDQLSEAVYQAIQIRSLPRLGPIGTYVSGGLDSRTILFSTGDRDHTSGINLYDQPNREAALSQQLCDAAQIKFIGYQREEDYYPRWMAQGVRASGGMWSLEDNHFLGTCGLMQELGVKTVLAAFPVDDVFKGAALEQSYVSVLGRKLPFFQFEQERGLGYLMETPARNAPPAYEQQIAQRLENWFAGTPPQLLSEFDRRLVEDRRIRPQCYQPATSDAMMFRVFPYDIFLADRAIADCYSRTPTAWKINARLWEQVVVRLCGRSVLDANRGWRPGSSVVEKLFVFISLWAKEKLSAKIASAAPVLKGPATNGSWPNLGWYVTHSPRLQELWEGAPVADRQQLTALWGSDPWQVPLSEWARPPVLGQGGLSHGNSPNGFFRLVTLLHYWDMRRSSKA